MGREYNPHPPPPSPLLKEKGGHLLAAKFIEIER